MRKNLRLGVLFLCYTQIKSTMTTVEDLRANNGNIRLAWLVYGDLLHPSEYQYLTLEEIERLEYFVTPEQQKELRYWKNYNYGNDTKNT